MIARLMLVLVVVAAAFSIATAAEFRLAPYKDKLFANPKPFQTLHGGSLAMVEYSVERDLRQRDEVPEKKAKSKYVSLDTQKSEQTLYLRDGSATTSFAAVGKVKGPAKIVVIFLHGRGAGYEAGFDDWNFGGNFNRIKNLMLRNDGVYISPSFSDFGAEGHRQILGIMRAYAENSPGAPMFLACASAAGALCVSLAEDPESAALLGGLLFLGASVRNVDVDAALFTGAKRPIPIYIGHGSKDPVVNWVKQELFLKAIKEAAPAYPIRFNLFVSGYHGTPMRMTDWRQVLNWMLAEGKS